MKKRFFTSIALFITVLLISFSALIPEAAPADKVRPLKDTQVTPMSSIKAVPDAQKVLEARFLNMLNHNFVYDNCFDRTEDVVNASILAILNKRDADNDSYISQNYVNDYIFNMYGIEKPDYSEINTDYPQIEGFVYIVPRGFSVYNHDIVSVNQNEDGSYTVTTNITVSSHDQNTVTGKAVTLFVKNEKSVFGYNIISSNILDDLSLI